MQLLMFAKKLIFCCTGSEIREHLSYSLSFTAVGIHKCIVTQSQDSAGEDFEFTSVYLNEPMLLCERTV